MPRTVWIIAGESSGDAYGALLAGELRQAEPDLVVRGMGGAAMEEAGVDIMVDSTELGVVGLVEVLKHLPTFASIFRGLVRRAEKERPDAVVLIDYPGLNLRLARRLHLLGVKVVYYISPQVWAWHKKRIPKIARTVDRMLVIFPFEPAVYSGTELDVEFVGHPLLETLDACRDPSLTRDSNAVLLLPGSRTSEVDRLLPVMLETARALHAETPGLRFVIAVPREAIAGHVRRKMAALLPPDDADGPEVSLEVGRTREWMQRAAAGLAASGTVTVEAAILGLPLVVVYRLHWLTFWFARLLVKIPYFAMVNLVANAMVFEEFLQDAVTTANLSRALRDVLPGGARRREAEEGMARTVAALGGQSQVSQRAAQAVIEVMG